MSVLYLLASCLVSNKQKQLNISLPGSGEVIDNEAILDTEEVVGASSGQGAEPGTAQEVLAARQLKELLVLQVQVLLDGRAQQFGGRPFPCSE